MSMKGKKKIRSWGFQRHSMERGDTFPPCKSGRNESILYSSIITGQLIEEGSPLKSWQEFVIVRQEQVEDKLHFGEVSSEHAKIVKQLDELLKDQLGEVSNAVNRLVVIATYIHYNKGFFDGMKLASAVGIL